MARRGEARQAWLVGARLGKARRGVVRPGVAGKETITLNKIQ